MTFEASFGKIRISIFKIHKKFKFKYDNKSKEGGWVKSFFHITVDFSINISIPDIKSDLYNFDRSYANQ